jgi:hypothetical protein
MALASTGIIGKIYNTSDVWLSGYRRNSFLVLERWERG